MRRLVAFALGVVLLAGACAGDRGIPAGQGRASSSASPERPTSSVAGSPAPSAAPGAGVETRPGSAAPIAQPSTREQAPVDGRYEYLVTAVDGTGQQQQAVQVLRVATDARGVAVRQTHRLAAAGRDSLSVMEWRPDGVWALSQRSEEGGSSSPDCDWAPDILEWPLPFRVGATWTARSTCSVGSSTRSVTVTGRVVRTENVQVGDRSVRAVVLERTRDEKVLLDGSVPIESKERSTDWVAVDNGLLLRSNSSRQGTGGLASGSSDRKLTHLAPR